MHLIQHFSVAAPHDNPVFWAGITFAVVVGILFVCWGLFVAAARPVRRDERHDKDCTNHLPLIGTALLQIQNDLAEHLTFFHVLVGGADFLEREDVVDDGLEASGEDVAKNFIQFAHRTHVGAEQRELA